MTFVEWIINAEKMTLLNYRRLPEVNKMKIRANYFEYCEIYNLKAQTLHI